MNEKIAALLSSIVARQEVDILEVSCFRSGKRSIARVIVDKKGGITVNECGRIAKELSVLSLVEADLPDNLLIEVSSPGIDRPLKSEADFIRKEGRHIRLLYLIEGAEKELEGIINSVNSGQLVLLGKNGEKTEIPLTAIIKAKQIIKF